ncbi:UDP-N-acetylglucosamine--poly-1,6-beta-N-acetylglucosamine N-acetylglucosaminyltransferase [Syntrophotalea carbinolica DSM 2380]|uniref:Poly-beta-1,6-N-acetyl-D-glucosamine synthase n=1 Tax=Syntrophotalea carbinolica (strain DSM 2380 / NBRC 103641 / GraBd1) TaxID=338963 RepID=Q3A0T2_SYNC1|nr:poly-beta-1,6-N-acetyl-D-glucosamine synthase [Syntrophotalea carbinolica]ABA90025.1 UDP-N-acetylglucosamine--poly-1,6-beta-N-acetylglucosamine N-acetylglucosaminyltransferase [Syntrophotalea carbinolica DSM 2380]
MEPIFFILQALLDFVFYYPLFMAYLWMVGGLDYYLRREYRKARPDELPSLSSYPLVSIIVPCHNEAEHLHDTIGYLFHQRYPDYEVIAVNDGSTDETGRMLDDMARENPQLRVVHFETNQGKAMGLRMASLVARGEFLVCIDGDALLDPDAIFWMMQHFLEGPRVGAVTGNPRIRTRSTLLGKIQVGEFSAILGLIKRAQRVYGRVFTMSGVVSAFRKTALHHVGYWSVDMMTEDIDISWRLQLSHWDIRFEPNALCWILMPETLKGLWNQRLRWAQGGSEVLLRYLRHMFKWRSRRMWGVYFEYFTSIIWSYAMLLIGLIWLWGLFFPLPADMRLPTLVPAWSGVVLSLTCLLQFAVAMFLDSRYERGLGRCYYVMIWYPLAFWLINMFTIVVGLPKALLKKRGERAVWTATDRGIY